MQSEVNQEEHLNRIITVPNLLSFFRLCLIPVIIWSFWVYVQDRKKRLQDVSDDGAIYMLPSVYSCIGITYNKTLLEVHGWELPKFFADLETWQRKQRRRGYSCAWHRSNIRKNRSKICVDF